MNFIGIPYEATSKMGYSIFMKYIYIYPIASMGLVYLPTFTMHINQI